MARILISWLALQNDFLKEKDRAGDTPDPDGPNSLVHTYGYKYDYHLLLSSAFASGADLREEHLSNYLRRTYRHDVRLLYMNMKDEDVINLSEVQAKIDSLLLKHKTDEIEIFASPGTPTMQVAWYFAHLGLKLKTRIFQMRPAKFTGTGQPEKIYTELERSNFTYNIIVREILSDTKPSKEILVTESMKPIYNTAEKVASTDKVTVLILGETGTGKEMLARHIVEKSPRKDMPFIAFNCAAMQDQLLESRLFGYVKNVYTDAKTDTKGLFSEAHGGTIFLDEIGDISEYMQKALLRVLQEKSITKVGSSKREDVDVRIIAATNKDLYKMSMEGSFRMDLFYRLSVVDIALSPLRELPIGEREEILTYFIKKKGKDFDKPELKLPKEIKKIIFDYSFPGNIRELENLIERLYAISEEETKIMDLPKNMFNFDNQNSLKLVDVENKHIKKVLILCNNNIKKASEFLDVSYNTIVARIRKYDIRL